MQLLMTGILSIDNFLWGMFVNLCLASFVIYIMLK